MTAVTGTPDFQKYHVVDCRGIVVASRTNLSCARDAAKMICEGSPELAPVTIHLSQAIATERHYSGSGTCYRPVVAKTIKERQLERGFRKVA